MAARFTYGKYIVMTGAAVTHDSAMIKRCGYKARGYVAHMAIFIGWHMVRWRCFAAGGCAIVARSTVINDAGVIEPGIGKIRCDMAHGAILPVRGQMVL